MAAACALTWPWSYDLSVIWRRKLQAEKKWRRGSESNRRTRICSPLHGHSATGPIGGAAHVGPGPLVGEALLDGRVDRGHDALGPVETEGLITAIRERIKGHLGGQLGGSA